MSWPSCTYRRAADLGFSFSDSLDTQSCQEEECRSWVQRTKRQKGDASYRRVRCRSCRPVHCSFEACFRHPPSSFLFFFIEDDFSTSDEETHVSSEYSSSSVSSSSSTQTKTCQRIVVESRNNGCFGSGEKFRQIPSNRGGYCSVFLSLLPFS